MIILKKYCKKVQREHNNKIISDLNNVRDTNPQIYWNLVEQLTKRNENEPSHNISLSDWTKYYKDLLNDNDNLVNDELHNELTNMENTPYFSELDFKISLMEVKKAVSSLKNNKASGLDELSGEMIKYAPVLFPVIANLFNAILNYNTYPSSWRTGYITSIYKK